MKKLFVSIFLATFIFAGIVSINTVQAQTSSSDLKIEKTQYDKDPVKDGDKKVKKETKTSQSTTRAGDCNHELKADCSPKADCSSKTYNKSAKAACGTSTKRSCCSKSSPGKK